MIRIYVVDDHTVVIEGIYSLLQQETGICIDGYANTAAGCLDYFKTHTADVILMDISLPDMNGVDLCKAIRKNYPGIMVLALSTFNQSTYVRKMVEAGASGYLLKNAGKREIVEAIHEVVKGKTYFSFDAGQALKAETRQQNALPQLTKREKEVLACIVEGCTNNQIADRLFISVDTVETHRKNLHSKLNVKNSAMLVRFAMEHQLL